MSDNQTIELKLRKRSLVVGGAILLAAILILSFAVPATLTRNSNKSTQADKIVARAGELILLPTASEPTVIEIEDAVQIRSTNPEFYKDVKNGDHVLMYPNKAVIYRQSSNLIINVAPIASNKPQ